MICAPGFCLFRSEFQRASGTKEGRKQPTLKQEQLIFCTCGDGTVACDLIKIKDEAISTFKLLRVNDNIFIVWDPKIPKSGSREPAEPKAIRLKRTAVVMEHQIVPGIVSDIPYPDQNIVLTSLGRSDIFFETIILSKNLSPPNT